MRSAAVSLRLELPRAVLREDGAAEALREALSRRLRPGWELELEGRSLELSGRYALPLAPLELEASAGVAALEALELAAADLPPAVLRALRRSRFRLELEAVTS